MTPPPGTTAALRGAPPGGSLREVVQLAYPVVLAQMTMTAMGVVESAMVGRLGATPLAAVGFGSVWLWTFLTIFYGTASGVQTFVSQADGAGNPQRCGAWAWQAGYAVVPAAAVAMLVIAFGREPLLALGALFQLFDAGAIITEGALRGAGDTRWPFVVHVLLGWGLLLPAAWAFGVLLEGGLTGAWLAGLLQVAALAAILGWRFRSGAWRHIRI